MYVKSKLYKIMQMYYFYCPGCCLSHTVFLLVLFKIIVFCSEIHREPSEASVTSSKSQAIFQKPFRNTTIWYSAYSLEGTAEHWKPNEEKQIHRWQVFTLRCEFLFQLQTQLHKNLQVWHPLPLSNRHCKTYFPQYTEWITFTHF